MQPPGARTVLVRHREIGTKSRQVQRRMETILAENVRAMLALREIEGTVEREPGRVFIHTSIEDVERATDAAADTFGVASASPVLAVDATLDDIKRALARTARERYDEGSFAVRARRAGPPDAHAFTSVDLEESGGSAIWDAVVGTTEPVVDLEDPTYTFYVECREEEAYVFLETRDGHGGFPLGTQGTVVALVSGGIDSPVAAWESMRRGCDIIPLYFDFEGYGGVDHVARAVESVRRLATYAPGREIQLHVVPIGDAVDRLVEEVSATRMLSLRRLMFAVAERLAHEAGAHALVTGESIGQKSSQTGPNLAATSADVRLPIHRPLLARDKQEIIELAKTIGTYEEATIRAGCNRIAPTHPETNATSAGVVDAEPSDLLRDVEALLSRTETVDIDPKSEPSPVLAGET